MNFDFEKALTFISKDSEWVGKLFTGAGLMLLSLAVFIFPFIAMLFGNNIVTAIFTILALAVFVYIQFAILGYGCETAQNIIKNKDEAVLPSWKDYCHFSLLGSKYVIGSILFMLPMIILYFSALFISSLIANNHGSLLTSVLAFIIFLTLLAVATVVYFFVFIFMPLFSTNFMKELKITSFVNFKQAFGLLKGHPLDYLVFYLLIIALSAIIGVIAATLIFTIIGAVLLPIVYFYGYLVYANLCAQFINKQPEPTQE